MLHATHMHKQYLLKMTKMFIIKFQIQDENKIHKLCEKI